jgi:hypothetical protein
LLELALETGDFAEATGRRCGQIKRRKMLSAQENRLIC